jgi:hypothetical protein
VAVSAVCERRHANDCEVAGEGVIAEVGERE